MEWFGEFNHMQNMARLVDLLDFETDPSKREALQAKLIQEEARVGQSKEQLDRVEEFIRRGRERIRLQCAVVDDLAGDHADLQAATSMLNELQRTQALFEHRRSVLAERISGRV